MSKPTLLIIDNDKYFLNIAKEYFELKNFNVIVTSNLLRAKTILENEAIAVTVVDYRLVDDSDTIDQSGINFLKEVYLSNTSPKILYTKFPNQKVARDVLVQTMGKQPLAIDYLDKSEGLTVLLEAIRNIIYKANLFLSYAKNDENLAIDLYKKLEDVGFSPWIASENILVGEKWKYAIKRAIENADFFILCLTKGSINRRGVIRWEIKLALEIWDEMFEDDIYFIPVKLEECDDLRDVYNIFQYVELYKPDGFDKLCSAIRTGIERKI